MPSIAVQYNVQHIQPRGARLTSADEVRSRPRGITPSDGGTIWHILHEGPNGAVGGTRHGQVVLVFLSRP
jgi:hypothetical protein